MATATRKNFTCPFKLHLIRILALLIFLRELQSNWVSYSNIFQFAHIVNWIDTVENTMNVSASSNLACSYSIVVSFNLVYFTLFKWKLYIIPKSIQLFNQKMTMTLIYCIIRSTKVDFLVYVWRIFFFSDAVVYTSRLGSPQSNCIILFCSACFLFQTRTTSPCWSRKFWIAVGKTAL